MKKIIVNNLILLLSLTLLFSCSSDSNTSSNNGFLRINKSNQNYSHEYNEGLSFLFEGIADNCDGNGLMSAQNVGQIETASFFLDVYLAHNETNNIFSNYNVSNSSIINWDIFSNCYSNFSLMFEYEDKTNNDEIYPMSINSNSHTITSVNLYREDTQEAVYTVEGNFSVSFVKPDNTTIPVTGEYKTFVYVLKD